MAAVHPRGGPPPREDDEEAGLRASRALEAGGSWRGVFATTTGGGGPPPSLRLGPRSGPAATSAADPAASPAPSSSVGVFTPSPGALDVDEPPGLPPEEREYRDWCGGVPRTLAGRDVVVCVTLCGRGGSLVIISSQNLAIPFHPRPRESTPDRTERTGSARSTATGAGCPGPFSGP